MPRLHDDHLSANFGSNHYPDARAGQDRFDWHDSHFAEALGKDPEPERPWEESQFGPVGPLSRSAGGIFGPLVDNESVTVWMDTNYDLGDHTNERLQPHHNDDIHAVLNHPQLNVYGIPGPPAANAALDLLNEVNILNRPAQQPARVAETYQPPQIPAVRVAPAGKYFCENCPPDHMAIQEKDRRSHNRQVHPAFEKVLGFKCDIAGCNEFFNTLRDLNRHKTETNIHQGKKVRCMVESCGIELGNRKDNRRRHYENQHPDFPLPADLQRQS